MAESKSSPSLNRTGILIFIIGLTIRILYIINSALKDPLFYHPIMDPLYHHQWALAIIRGGWLNELPYFRAPLYPHLLALCYFIFGTNLLIPRIIQAILGASSCYLVYLIGKRLFSEKIASYAGIITALYPILIYFDGEILIPSLLIFLILFGFLLLIRERLFLSGVFFGLAAITRPNILAFVAILIIYYIIKRKRFLPIVIGLIIPIVPITVRNYVVSKEVIPIAWQGGVNFYIGNNPKADGMTAIIPGTRKDWWGGYYDARRIVRDAIGHEPSYNEIDRFWFRKGTDFIVANPLKTIGLYFKKLYLLTSGFEIANNRSIYFFKNFTFLKYLIIFTPIFQFPFGLLLPLSIIGIYDFIRRKKHLMPLIFIFSYGASFLPFFINARYRTPLIPFLILFAVSGIFYLRKAIKKRELIPIFSLIPIFALINLNLPKIPCTNPAQDHLTLAGLYSQEGDLKLAFAEATKSLEYDNLAQTHNLLGLIYNKANDQKSALAQFKISNRLDKNFPESYLNIGNHYARISQFDSAFHYIQTACKLDPYNARALNSLGNLNFATGRLPEAEKLYLKASHLEPDYLSPLYHLALLYLRTDRRASALKIYYQMARIDPRNNLVINLRKRLQI